jgi:molecular chaperone DnaK (HSP70)
VRVGIDFGTTRTVIAGVDGGRHPVAAFDLDGTYRTWLPSVVAFDGERAIFGDAALDALRAGRPGLRSVKRAVSGLAPDARVPIEGGPSITSLALATRFLRWVKETLVHHGNLGLGPNERIEAMVAAPANASSRARFTTLEAFRGAGFQVLGMVNEPTAAAIEFAHRNTKVLSARSPKRYVVVYDLGGGTFDTAAVSLEGRRFSLLSSEGIARLGGDDFDAVLLEIALEAWGVAPDSLSEGATVGLLEACRAAKETLTARSKKILIDPAPILDREPAVLETSELYARAEPLVERTLELLERVFGRLREHGIDKEDARELGAVYLVGGGVAFPGVARALRSRYDKKTQLAPEPHAATAIGLAIAADEDAGILVREASTRTLGVWRESEGGRDTVFDPILEKDTLPEEGSLVVRRRYRPAHTVGHLRFVECTRLDAEGRPDGDLTPSRELLFPYDARLADEKDLTRVGIERTEGLGDEILETYTYPADGRVHVAIENVTHHYRRELDLGGLL